MHRRAAAAAAAVLLGATGACSSSSSSSSPSTEPTSAAATSTTTTTVTTTGPAGHEARWQLGSDFGRHPDENPFPGGASRARVWSLRQSDTPARTGRYPRLETYSRSFAKGVVAWHGATNACGGLPAIGLAVDGPATVCGATIPDDAVFVSPDRTRLAVVGWTSPLTGDVVIAIGLADLAPSCGGTVPYFVDRGTTSLANGTLARGGSKTLPALRAPVTKGESVYVLVGPDTGNRAGCDATQLQVTIAPAG